MEPQRQVAHWLCKEFRALGRSLWCGGSWRERAPDGGPYDEGEMAKKRWISRAWDTQNHGLCLFLECSSSSLGAQFIYRIRFRIWNPRAWMWNVSDFNNVVTAEIWFQIQLPRWFQLNGETWLSTTIILPMRVAWREWYPLVNVYITMERSTIFNGKIHYKWQFSMEKSTINHHIQWENPL